MSARSADALSTMSQPARNVSAPRLAPPRKNTRRAGSGMSFAASRIRSLASTPAGSLRCRDMSPRPSTARDHGAQGSRYQQRHGHVKDGERYNGRHGEEVHVPRRIIAAEHRGKLLQLYRLPNGKPGENDKDACENHDHLEQPLHGIIDR